MRMSDLKEESDPSSLSFQPAVGDPLHIVLNGKIIHRSQNLRGLITHARRAGVSSVSVLSTKPTSIYGEGLVFVVFADKSWCRVRFASFTIARDFFRKRWAKWGLYAEVRNSDTYWHFQ
jgi:hypothetical protein